MMLHAQAKEAEKALQKQGIHSLYHFTSVENLALIARCGGLWSKQKLSNARLLDNVTTGGNTLSLNLDRRRGNWGKIHLYFCPNTPMAYRVQQNPEGRDPQCAHICYLIIDHCAALWDGVQFTDTNATANDHHKESGLRGLGLVDFGIIKSTLLRGPRPWDNAWHKHVQAECLVCDEIPLECIERVAFITQASLKEGARIWGGDNHPPFIVEEKFFCTNFAMARDFRLTSESISKENISLNRFLDLADIRDFSKTTHSRITLMVHLSAVPGTKSKVLWRDSKGIVFKEREGEFDKPDKYYHWSSLRVAQLEQGDYSVEYYLRDIRWFKTNFSVGA